MPRRRRRKPLRNAPKPAGSEESAPAKKPLPAFDTVVEAERFLATADLDDYDLAPFEATLPAEPQARPAPQAPPPTLQSPSARYEFAAKSACLNMRLSADLLAAVKAEARSRGLPYQRFVRETLERAVGGG